MTPTPVFDDYIKAIRHDYHNPDWFIKVEIFDKYRQALKLIAGIVICDYHNLAIVDNATTGMNTILRSWPFKLGDVIVYHSTIYHACENILKFIESQHNITLIKLDLDYPMTDQQVIDAYEQAFKQYKPTMGIFDTITSMPAVRMPFESLIGLCKSYNVLSLIDGAHAIGLIPLDLGNLKPDFFTSNLHKWSFVPRGCAILYVDAEHHRKIHTLPISHSYLPSNSKVDKEHEKDWLIDRFAFIGSKNFASILSIESTLKFRNDVCGGEEEIHKYCFNLAKKVGELVSSKWNTEILDSNTMVTIEIPLTEKELDTVTKNYDSILEETGKSLMLIDKTFVPFILHNGKLYARFSCQIYNDLLDYEYASDVLMKHLKLEIEKHAMV